MGNGQSSHDSKSHNSKQDIVYTLSKGKEGYAVLLGNELFSKTAEDDTVGQKLLLMEETLSSLGLHVMAPFLTRKDIHKATFTNEEYKRICLMHFDHDMIQHLSGYSSFFVHYCGLCDQYGIVTKDKECILYTDIIKSVYTRTSGKPTIFIFDCVVDEPSLTVDEIIRHLEKELQFLPQNVFIFFNFQNNFLDQPGLFTRDLSAITEEFSDLISFPSITSISALRAKFINQATSYLTFNTMTAQLFFKQDLSLAVDSDIPTCATYCCVSIKRQGPSPLPFPDAFPGCGRKVFIVFASNTNGMKLESSLVWHLAKWLYVLGYDVYCDTPQCDDNEAWLRWYTAHIVSCKNIILVCSPELEKGFQSSTSSSRWSVCGNLISALYQKLDKDIRDRLRFFPVLLTPHKIDCIPSIFAGSKFYHFTGPPPDSFNPKQLRGSYDELVFHMSHLPLPSTTPLFASVQPLPDKKDPSPVIITNEMIASLLQPQDGYIPVPQPTPILREQPLIARPPCVEPSQQNIPIYITLDQPQITTKYSTRPVSSTAMLWLSQRIVEWKFLGRRLGLEEYQLSRIERDNPHSTGEKVIQLLFTWRDQNDPKNVTYDNLLNGLKYADGKKLCQDFIIFVNTREAENDS